MLCPDCGRSDGFCDCLLAGPTRATGASPRVSSTVPNGGAVTEGESEGSFARSHEPDGLSGADALESDWAGSLLEFLRDFEAASPQSSRPVSVDQSGRNRPVGRTPLALDHSEQGLFAATSRPSVLAEPTEETKLPAEETDLPAEETELSA
jgi:hypothetical protein